LIVPEMQQNVGRYRILRPLGRGAMGLVFLAEDPSLNRQVAIKMLDIAADSEGDREFLRTRLLRDARAAAVLSHPNIVAVYDIVEEGTSVYVVMEYIEGESLAAFLDRIAAPDHPFIAQVLRQAAAGLDYTHSKGIIHRDIKPGNIMICPGGGVKILDFGIARMNDVRTSTPTGVIMGTVDYMAPEQIQAVTVDGRADQFSLAAVAYRMMTGSTLFGRHSLATLAYKLVSEAPPSVCERNAAIPAAVGPVLTKALAKSPADRYPTCSAFVDELDQALAGEIAKPTSATTVRTAPPAPVVVDVPVRTRKSGMAALVAGGVLLAAGAGGVAIWRPWSQPAPVTATVVHPAETKTPEKEPVAPPKSEKSEPAVVTPPPKSERSEPKVVTPPPKTKEHPVATPKLPPVKAPEKPPEKKVPEQVSLPKEEDHPIIPPTAPPVKPPEKTVIIPPNPNPPVDANPPEQEPPFKRGLEQMRAKDYRGAIQSFSEAVKRRPRNAAAFYNRGFAYQESGDPAKAIEDYSEAARLNSRDPRVYANRGICEVRVHQDDAALADFNKALELDPQYAGAMNGRGGVFLRRRQYQVAIRDFTAAINANPNFVQAYENRANARRSSGDVLGANADMMMSRRLQEKK
jgi:serine/threonine protein kinase/Flp pilus assembly protein TadD